MDIFNILSLIGGLCLFLFGMNVMGQALERRAGGELRSLLSKLTTGKIAGLLTGIGVTAIIQSSSATTVMIVGFVNSGLMTLKQSINVIMGANIGTTVTAWILSLAGIDSSNTFIRLLKPASFTPILALIGIILYMLCKNSKKKDTGTILLGFAVLMFGMETMSGAVSGLGDIPEFQSLFVLFKNPILGMLAGAMLTAILQSSSASIGILQALAVTGQVSYSAAIPIVMGQNIGTCITTILSAIGANKNAKRTAIVHLLFNAIGTAILLAIFCLIKIIFSPVLFNTSATLFGIAAVHSVFNILCTMLMLPLTSFLEKLVLKIVPDSSQPEITTEIDERLLATPSIALERCRKVAADMAENSVYALKESLQCFNKYSPKLAESIREKEKKSDNYEDMLGTYLVKLGAIPTSKSDSNEITKLLKTIGDFERISDYAVNLLEATEEMKNKSLKFSDTAVFEFHIICAAINEILDLALTAFSDNDLQTAYKVEPLEEIIEKLKENIRTRHILRLQQGNCTMEAGFVLCDILTDLKRAADHCSNIAGCLIDISHDNMNLHESLKELRNDSDDFKKEFKAYANKYTLPSS